MLKKGKHLKFYISPGLEFPPQPENYNKTDVKVTKSFPAFDNATAYKELVSLIFPKTSNE